MTPKIAFPNVPIAEVTICRPFNPSGLFQYRFQQAMNLLEPPGTPNGELDRIPKEQLIAMQRPLAALVLFLNVVALEDFLRDLGQRLADTVGLRHLFPSITSLSRQSLRIQPNKPYARRDRDPFSLIDLTELNKKYSATLGVEPLSPANFPRLDDLILIRHTVAHHGSVIRSADVPRFQHYVMTAGQVINPPVSFVRDECTFIYQRMREFEAAVRQAVFKRLVPTLPRGWPKNPPGTILELVEIFNYFDKILQQPEYPPMTAEFAIGDAYFREQRRLGELKLVNMCIDDVARTYS